MAHFTVCSVVVNATYLPFACLLEANGSVLKRSFPLPLCQQKLRSLKVRSSKGREDGPQPASEGDPFLQEQLVQMLRLQVDQREIEEYVEEESAKLRQSAADVKQEADRVLQERNSKTEEAFDKVAEKVDEVADKFEQQLQEKRKSLEFDMEGFRAWQRQMNVDRSKGQFFKSLYQNSDDPLLGETSEMLQGQQGGTQAEPMLGGIPLLAMSAFVSVVLGVAVIADVMGPSPNWALVALYSAMGMGSTYMTFTAAQQLVKGS